MVPYKFFRDFFILIENIQLDTNSNNNNKNRSGISGVWQADQEKGEWREREGTGERD